MKLLLVLVFLFSYGCAQRIKVPINRFISPEAIGGGAEIEYRSMGFSAGVLDFSNNSTTNALEMGVSKDEELYLAAGIAQNVDLFLRFPEESSSMIGMKIQILGEPGKAQATGNKLLFTLGMGSERDEFDDEFKIELKSDLQDYSLVHGYRFSPSAMIYEGISLSHYNFEGRIKGTHSLDSSDLEYQAKNILGAHIGLILGGPSFKFKLEAAAQKISWTHTEEKTFQYFGMGLTVGW
jgi:hypothetical protein